MSYAISVIVPVYNVGKYLEPCVKSILGQTFRDFELILVDDGSMDECPAMCDIYARMDRRVMVIHKQNAGLGYARNSGIEVATGDFLCFVDADDYLAQNALADMYRVAVAQGADTVLACYERLYPDGHTARYVHPLGEQRFTGREQIMEHVLMNMLGSPKDYENDVFLKRAVWASLYASKVIRQHNIRFCSERDFISEDIIFNMDYYPHAESVALCAKPLYFYRYNDASLSKSYRPDRMERHVALIREMERKAALLGMDAQERIDRTMLGYARQCIYSEVRQHRVRQCLRRISQICREPALVTAARRYRPGKVPLQQHLLYGMVKHNSAFALYLACKLLK